MYMEDIISGLFGMLGIWLVIVAVIFLVTRAFWCWYWKINARLEEQKKTNQLLKNIYMVLIQSNDIQITTAEQFWSPDSVGNQTSVNTVFDNNIPDL